MPPKCLRVDGLAQRKDWVLNQSLGFVPPLPASLTI